MLLLYQRHSDGPWTITVSLSKDDPSVQEQYDVTVKGLVSNPNRRHQDQENEMDLNKVAVSLEWRKCIKTYIPEQFPQ